MKQKTASYSRAQQDCFSADLQQLRASKPLSSSSCLLTLSSVLDDAAQLIRVCGHLRRTPFLDTETIHPVVIEPTHKVTQLVTQAFDQQLSHPDAEQVFAEIRRR